LPRMAARGVVGRGPIIPDLRPGHNCRRRPSRLAGRREFGFRRYARFGAATLVAWESTTKNRRSARTLTGGDGLRSRRPQIEIRGTKDVRRGEGRIGWAGLREWRLSREAARRSEQPRDNLRAASCLP